MSTLPICPEEVFLAVEPVDIRQGIDRLSAYVQHTLGQTPCDGRVYAFRNRAANRIKLLVWDGNGVWLCVRRLHKGRFRWPSETVALFTLTAQEWHGLICGIDWQRLSARTNGQWQV